MAISPQDINAPQMEGVSSPMPDGSMEKVPDLLPDESIDVDVSAAIAENLKNFAEDEELSKKVAGHLAGNWSNIQDRSTYEDVWSKVDEMYRVKPSSDIKEKNRANFGSGVFTRSINQLCGMAFQVLMENKLRYKFIPRPSMNDEGDLEQARKNADILTDMLHIAMDKPNFKSNLRSILHSVYKYGNAISCVPFKSDVKEWKIKGQKPIKYRTPSLPEIEHVPIENVWCDSNIDGITDQQAVFIKDNLSWSQLRNDDTVILPKDKSVSGEMQEKKAVDQFPDRAADTTNQVKEDRFDNAGHDYSDKETGRIRHWVIWAHLPIDTETGDWEESNEWRLFRVRMLGGPDSTSAIIECRENPFPDDAPLLLTHQSDDDIGFYHISLGEKCETYHDQICTAQNQLADNRSKINRRPIFYDELTITHMDRYDFGHSNMIAVEGDPRNAIYEAQMLDMTATIMQTIAYNEQKIKEIANTTDAVLGVAMGGRTSANEYQGARMAATTPIYSDLSVIEESLMVGYMNKFAQYVHAFFTTADIVYFVGARGREFNFSMTGKDYSVVAEGVVYARDKAKRMQNLMQILQLTADATIRAKIMRRIAEAMELENIEDITKIPGYDQAVKAAIFENVSMLEYGNMEMPQPGEQHDIHLPIHTKAYMEAKRNKNPNASNIGHHIRETMTLRKQEQTPQQATLLSASGSGQGAMQGGPAPASPDLPEQATADIPMPA